jgi:selenoprotein W-related protein
LAADLKKSMDVEPKLTPGGGGVFDVSADGKLIFSKKQMGRFPTNEEVLHLLMK